MDFLCDGVLPIIMLFTSKCAFTADTPKPAECVIRTSICPPTCRFRPFPEQCVHSFCGKARKPVPFWTTSRAPLLRRERNRVSRPAPTLGGVIFSLFHSKSCPWPRRH